MEEAQDPAGVCVDALMSQLLHLRELLGVLARWLLLELHCDVCDCPGSPRLRLCEAHPSVGEEPCDFVDPKLVITAITSRVVQL